MGGQFRSDRIMQQEEKENGGNSAPMNGSDKMPWREKAHQPGVLSALFLPASHFRPSHAHRTMNKKNGLEPRSGVLEGNPWLFGKREERESRKERKTGRERKGKSPALQLQDTPSQHFHLFFSSYYTIPTTLGKETSEEEGKVRLVEMIR